RLPGHAQGSGFHRRLRETEPDARSRQGRGYGCDQPGDDEFAETVRRRAAEPVEGIATPVVAASVVAAGAKRRLIPASRRVRNAFLNFGLRCVAPSTSGSGPEMAGRRELTS